jgi:hypothetical protein
MQKNRRFYFKVLFASFALLLFSSCSTMQTIDISKRTRKFNADYLSTFKAVAGYCNERGFAITMADKDLGLLNTDYKENDGTTKFFFGNYRSKLNFSMKMVSENETQVIVNASAEKQGAFGSWTQTTMSEDQAIELFKKIFTGIQSQLDK